MSFFRSLFGPSKNEIWSQIANDIGGKYEEGEFWERSYINYQHANWEIVLDTFTRSHGKTRHTYTRMRAPFANKDGLYFKIYREGFFSGVGKFFGMQDIEIGDSFFDDNFIIKGNDEYQISRLLEDNNLKALIELNLQIHFSIRDDQGFFSKKYPEGVEELYFECLGTIKDPNRLKDLFDLFALTLERLVHIDSAYPDDPTLNFV